MYDYRGYTINLNYYNEWIGILYRGHFVTLASDRKKAEQYVDLDLDYFNGRQASRSESEEK